MPKPEKRMPESVLPSLRGKEAIEQKRGDTSRYNGIDISWPCFGDKGYCEEIQELFGDEVLLFCLSRLIANKGKLKIVSFGAGEFKGMLQLRKMLIKRAKWEGLQADIKIVEYALSRAWGVIAIKDAGEEELLKNGSIIIKPGKLELRQINDAEGADIMISRRGPFHKVRMDLLPELIQKAINKLAPGGEAFIEVDFLEEYKEKEIQEKLGEQFEVKGKRTVIGDFGQKIVGCYYKITRLK